MNSTGPADSTDSESLLSEPVALNKQDYDKLIGDTKDILQSEGGRTSSRTSTSSLQLDNANGDNQNENSSDLASQLSLSRTNDDRNLEPNNLDDELQSTNNSYSVLSDDSAVIDEHKGSVETASNVSAQSLSETQDINPTSDENVKKEPIKFEIVEDPYEKATNYLSERHIFELFQVNYNHYILYYSVYYSSINMTFINNL